MATVTSLDFSINSKWDGSGIREAKAQIDELDASLRRLAGDSARITIELDDSGAKAKIDEIKRDLDTISNKNVEIKADTSSAVRSVDEIKRDLDAISNKSVDVKADTSSATRSVSELKRDLETLSSQRVQINADDTKARAEIAQIKRDLDAISNKSVEIKADDGSAKATIDDLKARLAALSSKRLEIDAEDSKAKAAIADVKARLDTLRDKHLTVDVDTKDSNERLKAMTDSTGKLATAVSGSLVPALVAVAPAIVPITAGAVAMGGAVVSSFTSASLAVAPFAASLFGTFKSATQLYSALEPLNNTMDRQKAVLATLTPGTKAYTAEQAKIADTQRKINQAMSEATPIQQQLAQRLVDLKDTWQKFQQQAEKTTGPILSSAFEAVTAAIPKMLPLVQAVGPIFQKLADQAVKFAQSNGFKDFVDWVVKNGVPNLKNILDTVGHLFVTLGQIVRDFAPLGLTFTTWLSKITAELDKWGQNGGFQRFAETVRQEAPAIGAFFKALGEALVQVTKAMAGLGPSSLVVVTALLKLVAALPVPVIQALAIGIVAVRAAMIAYAAATVIATVAQVALAAASSPFLILMAGAAVTILAVIAVVAALGVGLAELVIHWKAVSSFISGVFTSQFNEMVTILKAFASWVTSTFAPVFDTVKNLWTAAWNAIKALAEGVWNGLKALFQGFMTAMKDLMKATLDLMTGNWSGAWNNIRAAGEAVWNAIKAAWQATMDAMKTAATTTMRALQSAWSTSWNAIKAAGQAVWDALKTAWTATMNALKSTTDTVMNALKAAWQASWNAIKAAADAVWNATKAAWQATLNTMKSVYDGWSNALKSAWSAFWNAIKSAAQAVWTAMQAAWQAVLNAMRAAYNAMSSAFQSAWQSFWNTIKSVAQTVWNAISSGFSSFASGVESTLSGLVSKAQSIWNGIVNVFKTPVNVVIGIWDKVAGAVGLSPISKVATGGYISGDGGPTDDKIPAMLSNGEYVVNASAVNHYGVDTLQAINQKAYAGGGQVTAYAGGGIVGTIKDIGGGIAGAAKDVGGAVVGASQSILNKLKGITANLVYDVTKPILDTALKAVPHPIPGVATPAGNVPYQGVKTIIDGILAKLKAAEDAAKAAAASQQGGAGTIPSAAHKAIIDQALAKAGIPKSQWAQWEAGLNTLISRESSWNPNAINLTDSNAKAGHPSQGLMQTIPATFAKYGMGGSITNPVDNIVAGIRYINAVYGGIGHVQQANASAKPKGYAHGTGYAAGGLAVVGEAGPEMVNFRGGESVEPFQRLLAAARGDARGGGDVNIPININANGGNSQEVVAQIEAELIPKLRLLMQQHVGWRNR